MPTKTKGHGSPVPKAELQLDVDAYIQAGGNKSEAARLRKLHRHTYRERLAMAERVLGVQLGKVVDGRVDLVEATRRPLPPKGTVARYILSSCQNNTHPHPGFISLKTYCNWLGARRGDTCELILGSFSYAIDAYGAKSVKRGSYKPQDQLWYAPDFVPFIKDDSIELAPGLVWCGEQNILPTAPNPLVGLDDYNGRNSNIIPHARIAMESVASLADEATKFNYSTGAVTMRNYIQKRAGILGERRHNYGGLIVEVDCKGNWYVRQLHIGRDNEVYDIGPRGFRAVRVTGTKVEVIKANAPPDQTWMEAITFGDIHAAEMDVDVRELGWSKGGFLDQLAPRRQFWHDVFSMRSRGHHDIKSFHQMYRKFALGEDNVEDEMQVTADFLTEAHREWCEAYVVRSNHDRHLDRWLDEADPKRDLLNARYYNRLQERTLKAFDEGDADFMVLEFALRTAGIPAAIAFLGEDDSKVICRQAPGGGIECALHGDLGPNGSRGSTRALTKLGRAATKCHDHTARIMGPVYSAGACSLDFPYMKGPNAHSVSHVPAWINGTRQVITFWAGKFRA
jgi:hypothetical protein